MKTKADWSYAAKDKEHLGHQKLKEERNTPFGVFGRSLAVWTP